MPKGKPTPTPTPLPPLPPNTPTPTEGPYGRTGASCEVQVWVWRPSDKVALRAGGPQRATTSSYVAPCQESLAWSRSCSTVTVEQPASRSSATMQLCLMGTARLRDALDRFPGGFAAFALRHVADRNDADEPLLAVQHRQAPHLDIAHVFRDVVEILVVVAIHYL